MKKNFFFQMKILLFRKICLYSMKKYFYLESLYFHARFFHVKIYIFVLSKNCVQ